MDKEILVCDLPTSSLREIEKAFLTVYKVTVPDEMCSGEAVLRLRQAVARAQGLRDTGALKPEEMPA